MSRKQFENMIKTARLILTAAVLAALILPVSACSRIPADGRIPVVTYENKEIRINGEFFARSEHLFINRIDSRVISMITDDGYINMDADGNEIKLGDVITNRYLYEATIKKEVGFKIAIRNAPLFVDKDEMMKFMSSYDKSMNLPFILYPDNVSILYKDTDGYIFNAASYNYDSGLVDQKYAPGDGLRCSRWMTGRIGYSIPELKLKEYKDHWAVSSLEIENFDGRNYIWFCIRYEDESGSKTYYSAVVKETDSEKRSSKYRLIHAEKVPEGFVCCNIDEFRRIMKDPQSSFF